MPNDYRNRETSAAEDRMVELVVQFAVEYERAIQRTITETAERQAREAGASEQDIARLRRHGMCREQWRWN